VITDGSGDFIRRWFSPASAVVCDNKDTVINNPVAGMNTPRNICLLKIIVFYSSG
jgi:hypothetical protein